MSDFEVISILLALITFIYVVYWNHRKDRRIDRNEEAVKGKFV